MPQCLTCNSVSNTWNSIFEKWHILILTKYNTFTGFTSYMFPEQPLSIPYPKVASPQPSATGHHPATLPFAPQKSPLPSPTFHQHIPFLAGAILVPAAVMYSYIPLANTLSPNVSTFCRLSHISFQHRTFTLPPIILHPTYYVNTVTCTLTIYLPSHHLSPISHHLAHPAISHQPTHPILTHLLSQLIFLHHSPIPAHASHLLHHHTQIHDSPIPSLHIHHTYYIIK